ncbi:MAG: hypothetical protein ACPHVR_02505, partial [Poseidonia sp.]
MSNQVAPGLFSSQIQGQTQDGETKLNVLVEALGFVKIPQRIRANINNDGLWFRFKMKQKFSKPGFEFSSK